MQVAIAMGGRTFIGKCGHDLGGVVDVMDDPSNPKGPSLKWCLKCNAWVLATSGSPAITVKYI